LGRHTLLDTATGFDVTRSGDTFGPGGRHSREVMDAPTQRLPALANPLTKWFGVHTDPDTDSDTEFVTGSADPVIDTPAPTRPDTRCTTPLPPRPATPHERPRLSLMQRVLDGLKRKTWGTTPAEGGDAPDEPTDEPGEPPD
jgi:hypothetical protein